MKKIIKISALLTGILFFAAIVSTPVLAQTVQTPSVDKKAIPANVMKVIDKSCADCHKTPGMKMAMGVLNLSGWDNYTPEKQAAKAKAMCNIVTKGKMPPKSYKNNNPGKVPTADDLKVICDWATSLQAPK